MAFNPPGAPIDAATWKPSLELSGLALRRCSWVNDDRFNAIQPTEQWLRVLIVSCYYQGLVDGIKHMSRKQRKNMDPRFKHEFLPNRQGRCKVIIGSEYCGEMENFPPHQRWLNDRSSMEAIDIYIQKRNNIQLCAENISEEVAQVCWSHLGVASRHIVRVVQKVISLTPAVEQEIKDSFARAEQYLADKG